MFGSHTVSSEFSQSQRWRTDEPHNETYKQENTHAHTQQRRCWLMRSRWTTQSWQFNNVHTETNMHIHVPIHQCIHANSYMYTACGIMLKYENNMQITLIWTYCFIFYFPFRHTCRDTQYHQGVHLFN